MGLLYIENDTYVMKQQFSVVLIAQMDKREFRNPKVLGSTLELVNFFFSNYRKCYVLFKFKMLVFYVNIHIFDIFFHV